MLFDIIIFKWDKKKKLWIILITLKYIKQSRYKVEDIKKKTNKQTGNKFPNDMQN